VRWFGKNWGAPVCKATEETDPPVGQRCQRCGKKIKKRDQGIALDLNSHVWHLDCFIKCVKK